MSERERWIVYPLLLFALGAAVRDKLMQRIESKEIRCESLQIVDHQAPDVPLAELTFKRAVNSDPTQLADRVGSLMLRDSDGNEVCDIGNNLVVGSVVARQLRIIDPNLKAPVIAMTEPQPTLASGGADSPVSYQGVIYLNNQRLVGRLAPRPERNESTLSASDEATEGVTPPVGGQQKNQPNVTPAAPEVH